MNNFPRQVISYVTAKFTGIVSFPNGDVACRWCPLLKFEKDFDRHTCTKTGERIFDYKHHIGFRCPLEFIEEKESEVLDRG